MPAVSSSLIQLDYRSCGNFGYSVRFKPHDAWSLYLSNNAHGSLSRGCRRLNVFLCQSQLKPSGENSIAVLKAAAKIFSRSYIAFQGSPLVFQLAQAVGVIAFASWGIKPVAQYAWILFRHKSESSWKRSEVHNVVTSYIQPVLLWTGAILLCRALEPTVLPSVASQVVKQRLLTFVRSLSSVLALAYCLSSLIQQTQRFFAEAKDSSDARNMGVEFAGKAIYTAVWVAAISLFMELLGFSTQKWLTAGGLGTVLLTLAGREIFTNFLSSIMIHTTRPFVLNDWIQTKIEGYEVSGTVEHVGWWSPTVIRGDDREAVHIPNHKFTVNIVRNLTQKTHWRIKTHIAISHLDVTKINNIVADMRKVLSKNPQIEQQKLHRRVFLDNIHTESQALMIMISCFVKTSRFEEYQCVKEAILLDLLRVISHHHARLATPMRTVQKIYRDADVDDAPFVESIFSRTSAGSGAANRPFLLIEPQYKVYNDDKTKTSSSASARPTTPVGPVPTADNKKVEAGSVPVDSDLTSNTKESSGNDDVDKSSTTALQGKQEVAEKHVPSSSTTKSSSNILEENIVLGVALEGSKRMLQIEEDSVPTAAAAAAAAAATTTATTSAPEETKNMAVAGKDNRQEESGGQAANGTPNGH